MAMYSSRAEVVTDHPTRYAQQPVAHLGRTLGFIEGGDTSTATATSPATVRTRVTVPLRFPDGYSTTAEVFTFHGLLDGEEHHPDNGSVTDPMKGLSDSVICAISMSR